MPVDIQARENDLDRLEEHEQQLAMLGIRFKRSAPDRLLIQTLPEVCCYPDIESLVRDIIDHCKKKEPGCMVEGDMIAIIATHANDSLPEALNSDEQQLLVDYCLRQQASSQELYKKRKWRVLHEQDLKKILFL